MTEKPKIRGSTSDLWCIFQWRKTYNDPRVDTHVLGSGFRTKQGNMTSLEKGYIFRK